MMSGPCVAVYGGSSATASTSMDATKTTHMALSNSNSSMRQADGPGWEADREAGCRLPTPAGCKQAACLYQTTTQVPTQTKQRGRFASSLMCTVAKEDTSGNSRVQECAEAALSAFILRLLRGTTHRFVKQCAAEMIQSTCQMPVAVKKQ